MAEYYFNIILVFVFIGLGSIWEVLHNSYVKGGLALGALLGPGRGQLDWQFFCFLIFVIHKFYVRGFSPLTTRHRCSRHILTLIY